MREAVGSTWIYGLVLSFTLIFAGFLVLVLSYSKAYKIKNEITSIIEKYEGLTTKDDSNKSINGSVNIINSYLSNNGYTTKGKCQDGEYGVEDYESNPELAEEGKKYLYCVGVTKNNQGNRCGYVLRVTVFYQVNLPVLGRITKYSISGQTNEMQIIYINGKQLQC